MSENTNYKFGDNQAEVYTGIKHKVSPLKKIGFINSVCLFFTLFLVANIANSLSVELNIDRQTNSLLQERAKVIEENEVLKSQIKFYKSNQGIEKIARDNLGLIKNNEIPVRYIEKK